MVLMVDFERSNRLLVCLSQKTCGACEPVLITSQASCCTTATALGQGTTRLFVGTARPATLGAMTRLCGLSPSPICRVIAVLSVVSVQAGTFSETATCCSTCASLSGTNAPVMARRRRPMPGTLRALLTSLCLLEETATDAEHGASWRMLAIARTLPMMTWALCRSRRNCADILRARSETCLMPRRSRVFSLRHRLQTRLRREQASGRLLRLSRSQQRMLLWRLWNRAMRKLQRALRKKSLRGQLAMVPVRAASESTTRQFPDRCAGIRRCMAMTRTRSCTPNATSRGDRRRRPNMRPLCQG